jgi:hypothetical protein
MRLAFCFLSNREDGIRNLNLNFQYDINAFPDIIDSFSKNILINPPIQYDAYISGWNTEWIEYHSAPTIDMFSLRQDSLAMARNADIIYIGDDDMAFKEGSSEVINECCSYMQDNPDCGAIYLGGNFGGEGALHKDEIYITNKGHVGTNRGILARNRDEILDNRLHALGANFDAVVAFTCLLDGLYVARKLHVPIQHYTTNIMKEGHKDIFYDLNYLRTKGIMARVNEVIGKWEDHAIWPENIFKYYRQAAMIAGYIPKYYEDGEIQ